MAAAPSDAEVSGTAPLLGQQDERTISMDKLIDAETRRIVGGRSLAVLPIAAVAMNVPSKEQLNAHMPAIVDIERQARYEERRQAALEELAQRKHAGGGGALPWPWPRAQRP